MAPGSNPSLVGVALRDLEWLREVAGKVASHGFGELLARTPLGLRLFGGPAPGQILSMRRDLVPAFETLQDAASVVDFAAIRAEVGA